LESYPDDDFYLTNLADAERQVVVAREAVEQAEAREAREAAQSAEPRSATLEGGARLSSLEAQLAQITQLLNSVLSQQAAVAGPSFATAQSALNTFNAFNATAQGQVWPEGVEQRGTPAMARPSIPFSFEQTFPRPSQPSALQSGTYDESLLAERERALARETQAVQALKESFQQRTARSQPPRSLPNGGSAPLEVEPEEIQPAEIQPAVNYAASGFPRAAAYLLSPVQRAEMEARGGFSSSPPSPLVPPVPVGPRPSSFTTPEVAERDPGYLQRRGQPMTEAQAQKLSQSSLRSRTPANGALPPHEEEEERDISAEEVTRRFLTREGFDKLAPVDQLQALPSNVSSLMAVDLPSRLSAPSGPVSQFQTGTLRLPESVSLPASSLKAYFQFLNAQQAGNELYTPMTNAFLQWDVDIRLDAKMSVPRSSKNFLKDAKIEKFAGFPGSGLPEKAMEYIMAVIQWTKAHNQAYARLLENQWIDIFGVFLEGDALKWWATAYQSQAFRISAPCMLSSFVQRFVTVEHLQTMVLRLTGGLEFGSYRPRTYSQGLIFLRELKQMHSMLLFLWVVDIRLPSFPGPRQVLHVMHLNLGSEWVQAINVVIANNYAYLNQLSISSLPPNTSAVETDPVWFAIFAEAWLAKHAAAAQTAGAAARAASAQIAAAKGASASAQGNGRFSRFSRPARANALQESNSFALLDEDTHAEVFVDMICGALVAQAEESVKDQAGLIALIQSGHDDEFDSLEQLVAAAMESFDDGSYCVDVLCDEQGRVMALHDSKSLTQQKLVCWNCGQEGHQMRECPIPIVRGSDSKPTFPFRNKNRTNTHVTYQPRTFLAAAKKKVAEKLKGTPQRGGPAALRG